jgi:hypothetical protein
MEGTIPAPMRFGWEGARENTRLGQRGPEMEPAERYRRYALKCLRLAQLITRDADRALLLQMAEAWRHLAERAEAQFAEHASPSH